MTNAFIFFLGATIGKGLNRGLATLAAGALGLGARHLASLTGKSSEPFLIGLFVFIQAVVLTFIRFFPKVKARYDYGMLIFILTFCLVSISGFQTDEIFNLAKTRVSTIPIGAATCIIVCIFVCPVWAGEDLHKFVAQNIEEVESFLEGSMDEGFTTSDKAQVQNTRPFPISLNRVLVDSKSKEETLVSKQFRVTCIHATYLNIKTSNTLIWKFTPDRPILLHVEALNGYLSSKFQAPKEIQCTIKEAFSDSGKALQQLAWAVKTMTKPSSLNPRIANLKIASGKIKSVLKSDFCKEHNNLMQVIRIAAMLIDTISSVEQIADAVHEFSSLAKFKAENRDGVEADSENGKNKNFIQIEMVKSVNITTDGGDRVRVEGQSDDQQGGMAEIQSVRVTIDEGN